MNKYLAVLQIGIIPKMEDEIDAETDADAQQKALRWAKTAIALYRQRVPEHRWGHWWESSPRRTPELPEPPFQSFMPILDGALTLKRMETIND